MDFEEHVRRALDSIPPDLRRAMQNVEVVVESEAPAEFLAGLGRHETLLGHYHGVPLTDRGIYDGVLPDKISIYEGPIVRLGGTPAEIREEVRRTVVHEVAHHFGIDDDRLTELGWD